MDPNSLNIDPNDGTMNPEAVVGAFFDSLDSEEQDEQAPEEAPEDAEGEDADEDSDEDSEDATEAPEAESEDAEDEDEEAEEEEDDLDPVEKRFRHLQSLHDRQLAEVRAQLDQMNQWAQQVYQAQLAQHQAAQQAQQQPQQDVNPLAHISAQHVKQAVETDDLRTTFQQVAHYRPDLVPTTISAARAKYGDEIADAMVVEYNDFRVQQIQAANEEREAERRAAREAQEEPQMIQAAMSNILNDVAQQYGPVFEEIKPDFIQRVQQTAPQFKAYMDQQGYEVTPDAVRHYLVSVVNDIREERITAAAAQPRKPRRQKAAEHVETSTNAAGARPEDMTADDAVINEILNGAKELQMDYTLPPR